jgi:hypothetical protein
MKRKAACGQSILEMAENRANARQVPGHSLVACTIASPLRVSRPAEGEKYETHLGLDFDFVGLRRGL